MVNLLFKFLMKENYIVSSFPFLSPSPPVIFPEIPPMTSQSQTHIHFSLILFISLSLLALKPYTSKQQKQTQQVYCFETQFEDAVLLAGKSRQGDPESVYHIVLTVMKQTAGNAGAQLILSVSFSPGPLPQNSAAHVQDESSHSSKPR